ERLLEHRRLSRNRSTAAYRRHRQLCRRERQRGPGYSLWNEPRPPTRICSYGNIRRVSGKDQAHSKAHRLSVRHRQRDGFAGLERILRQARRDSEIIQGLGKAPPPREQAAPTEKPDDVLEPRLETTRSVTKHAS